MLSPPRADIRPHPGRVWLPHHPHEQFPRWLSPALDSFHWRLWFGSTFASGQAATVTTGPSSRNPVVLSPFEVSGEKDSGGAAIGSRSGNVNNVFDQVTDRGTAYRYTRWTDPRQIVTTFSLAY
jgi:hypothetical protein